MRANFGIRFMDNSDEIKNLLKGASEATAHIIGNKIAGYAKSGVAKAKGPLGNPWPQDIVTALRQSITCEIENYEDGDAILVGSNMQVAPYIELGTGKLYDPPPEWIEYHGNDAHSVGGLDWWIYEDEWGDWKIGKPVPSQPYLRPAIIDHIKEYKEIITDRFKREVERHR